MRLVMEDGNGNECLILGTRGLITACFVGVIVLSINWIPCWWSDSHYTEWYRSSWAWLNGEHPYWQEVHVEPNVIEFGALVDGRRHGLWCRCSNESVSWVRLHYGLPEAELTGTLQQPPMLTAQMRRLMGSEFAIATADAKHPRIFGNRQFSFVKNDQSESGQVSFAAPDSH